MIMIVMLVSAVSCSCLYPLLFLFFLPLSSAVRNPPFPLVTAVGLLLPLSLSPSSLVTYAVAVFLAAVARFFGRLWYPILRIWAFLDTIGSHLLRFQTWLKFYNETVIRFLAMGKSPVTID